MEIGRLDTPDSSRSFNGGHFRCISPRARSIFTGMSVYVKESTARIFRPLIIAGYVAVAGALLYLWPGLIRFALETTSGIWLAAWLVGLPWLVLLMAKSVLPILILFSFIGAIEYISRLFVGPQRLR